MCLGSAHLILRNDVDGSSSGFFNRSMAEYNVEFGSPDSHYWVGLESLAKLPQSGCQLRIDLERLNGSCSVAKYSSFSVGDASNKNQLTIGGYSGDAGDAMASANGKPFSTYDVDNNGFGCGLTRGGGFWYNYCSQAYITTTQFFSWFSPLANPDAFKLKTVDVHLLC